MSAQESVDTVVQIDYDILEFPLVRLLKLILETL